ncbi:A/G-specific adenine glycosylase [Chitinimonas sp. BJB300]|uniref:A/G-specific adenine glycosylase n=1 Tax=Chitinimonas sp. BJB300 TaxID=1559339 RepID=UPI000C0F1751|nr:A/G-specific adenine glycosylase [Chitinimonas sp. BJB300]PHV10891.1 A/G-specific adenine glycosylase [Chitinimonas sp. BJB300]TSJ88178.1 A/G-specific adenine glycosylase [Chitinimonas sp. BJB300]
MSLPPFADRLTRWQRAHGRHDLPWQVTDPYRVWLSEIMLQQTQVATIIAYYQRFTTSFPTVADLAKASLDDVLAHWAGLGYYTRARNLHKAAQKVRADFGGVFPQTAAQIETLPGIGRSTAAAIAGFCFAERTPILDGNVKRVLTRWAGIEGFPGEKKVESRLWQLAEDLLPEQAADMPAFTQGLMDLGATLCTRSKPACPRCPLREDCRAHIEDRTAELPTRKIKKAIPERETVMLLIQHEGKLLLERRPPTGIWGGLWSLPQADSPATATALCHSRFGLVVDTGDALPALVHTFTHFRLTITPLVLTVRDESARIAEPDSQWFTRGEALKAGIPTPVRKLLQAKPRPQADLFS